MELAETTNIVRVRQSTEKQSERGKKHLDAASHRPLQHQSSRIVASAVGRLCHWISAMKEEIVNKECRNMATNRFPIRCISTTGSIISSLTSECLGIAGRAFCCRLTFLSVLQLLQLRLNTSTLPACEGQTPRVSLLPFS